MDRGAWRAIVHGVARESDTTERTCTHRLHTHTHTHTHTVKMYFLRGCMYEFENYVYILMAIQFNNIAYP